MTTLSAWNFNTPQGADEAPAKLNRVFLISRHDEVVVSWEAGRKKPKTVILPV